MGRGPDRDVEEGVPPLRHSSIVTLRFDRPPCGEDPIIARVAAGEEPGAAAEAMEPPLLLRTIPVLPGVEMCRPLRGGNIARGTWVVLPAEAKLGHRPLTAVRTLQRK